MGNFDTLKHIKFDMKDTPCPQCGDQKAYQTQPQSLQELFVVTLSIFCTNRKCTFKETHKVDIKDQLTKNDTGEIPF